MKLTERAKRIREYLSSIDPEMIVFDGLEEGIIGTAKRGEYTVPVYDWDDCSIALETQYSDVEDIEERQQMVQDHLNEWTMETMPYLHEREAYMLYYSPEDDGYLDAKTDLKPVEYQPLPKELTDEHR